MKLGFAHPDHWLKTVTSRQVAEWLAFAMLEKVGEPPPPDKEEQELKVAKTKRDNLRGWFTSKTGGHK